MMAVVVAKGVQWLPKQMPLWKTPITTPPICFLPPNSLQKSPLALPFTSSHLHITKFQQPTRRNALCKANLTEKSSVPSTPEVAAPDSQKHSKYNLDDKPNQTVQQGSSPNNWDWVPSLPHVLTAAMANFLFGYHIGVINGPLSSIAQELGFDGDTIMEGFVVSIFLIGAFLGSVSGGVLSDKLGRRRTFQLDMLPMILGAALSASTQTVEGMLLGRFLVGLGIGVNTALVPLYISEIAPTKYRGALGSICQVGTCIGIITALVIGITAETDPHWWRTMFWLGTIPAAYLVVAMQFTAESPRWLAKVGRWEEAEKVIESLWGKSEVEKAMEELKVAEEGQDDEVSWAELLLERNFKVAAIGGALFMLQQFAGINGVLYFSSLTLKDAGITNSTTASAAVGVTNLIGALVALSLMDTQGRRKLLMGSYFGMAISMLTLVLALEVPFPDQVSHFLSVAGMLAYVYLPLNELRLVQGSVCSVLVQGEKMSYILVSAGSIMSRITRLFCYVRYFYRHNVKINYYSSLGTGCTELLNVLREIRSHNHVFHMYTHSRRLIRPKTLGPVQPVQ